MDVHEVAESGITVGGRDLYVIVFYALVLIMFVIAFVEKNFPIHLELYFRIYSSLCSVDILLFYNS